METLEEYQTATDGQLSERDELLAASVASGLSIKASAASVHLSERQAYRIASEPAFKARVSEIRTAAVADAVGALSSYATGAAEKLKKLTTCGDPSVELRASIAILDRFTKLSESVDLRSRIEALEAKARQ